MERVVNIIGMGASGASVGDTGENWGLNNAYKRAKLDKLFFFDDFSELMVSDSQIAPHDKTFTWFLKEYPDVEIISRFEDTIRDTEGNSLGKIKAYPLNEATKLAPGGFFTSTIAYAICYAILEKVDRIRLYGFEIWSGSDANEYMYQRPCVDFWLAYAMGRGIKVEVPWYLMLTTTNNQNYYGYSKVERLSNFKG